MRPAEIATPPRSAGAGSSLETPAPLGAHALPAAVEALRRTGGRLGRGPLARRAVSLLRRLVCLGRPGPFDVEVFPGRRARLHPRDNLSEKRAFAGPQFFDPAERAALAEAIRRGPRPFAFVDAGANAGLYTLWALSVAGPDALHAVAVEPEPTMAERLRVNLAGSGACVVEAALAERSGQVRLSAAGANRGEVRLDAAGAVEVGAVTLAGLAEAQGLARIDALKIDIEGAEHPVLAAFFRAAPRALWPTLVLIEAPRGGETPALALLRERGYRVRERTRLNAVLTAPDRTPRAAGPAGGEAQEDRDGQA
ncbi:MAG: FkbM family methyltransferase [Paracoccaceae bacterium]